MEIPREKADQQDGWEAHRIAQLRRFRALSLREKVEAIEGMAGVVRRFEQMRREGAFRSQEGRTGGSGGGANDAVSESKTPSALTSEGKSLTRHDRDWRRIEVIDDVMAEVLRRKTPAERIAIGFGLWRSARKILRAQLASLHPEWDARRLEREVARRLSHGAV